MKIAGNVLMRAMSTWVDPSSGAGTAWGTAPDGSRVYWQQRSATTPVDPGSYSHFSGGETLANQWIGASFVWIGQANDQRELGTTLDAGVPLYRSTPVQIGAGHDYPLDATIAEWRPQSAADPWFMQLQLQTEGRSNTSFRACWHMRVPNVIRLSCGLFDRLTGEHRGIVVVDDSGGLGAKTWQTQ